MSSNGNSQVRSMAPFFTIWTGQAFSLLGSQLVQFALVWYLTRTTGSATVLALASMMAILPQVFISPLAGALVDRWNRRAVMLAADGLIALATVLLAVLFAAGRVQVWHIYTLMLFRAMGGAFHWPAMQASTTLMVPEKHLSRVAGLNQMLWGAAGIVAPPLGALLLSVLPMQAVLAIDVGTAALAILPLVFIAIPQPERRAQPDGSPTTMLSDMREGLAFIGSSQGFVAILAMAMLINLLVMPAFSLLPLLVTNHFGGGVLELAWLQSAEGLGMVAGGLALGAWGGFRRRIVTAMLGLIFMGFGLTVVGVAPAGALPLAVGALFLSGFMSPIVNGSFMALLQATVPPEIQGRIFTLVMAGSSAMMPVGLAIAGPVADALGVPFWFIIGGLATAAMGGVGFLMPAVIQIESQAAARRAAAPLDAPDLDARCEGSASATK